MLWRDESENAILAQRILTYGVPKAEENGNLVTTERGMETNDDGLYIFLPWGPYYLTALSFKLFGVSTWSARFPFALLGLLTLFLWGGCCRRTCSNPLAAPLAVWGLLLSVPFYLCADSFLLGSTHETNCPRAV